jgi:hypothetical protein
MFANMSAIVARARSKLTNALRPERVRPKKVVSRWRIRACEGEAILCWQSAGGESTGRPRPAARSQTGDDALLWDLLCDRTEGFFIETGAHGYTFSLSYLFGCNWEEIGLIRQR